MKNGLKLLFVGIIWTAAATAIFAPEAQTEPTPQYFGACYTLYNCQGSSMGSFDETQCRNMGGHSLNSGGLCINL